MYRGGSRATTESRPAVEPIRVWHLLTHTAGLTYGFHYAHPVDALYRAAGFEWGNPPGLDLAGCCDVWAGLPLLFEPGSEFNYSVATDVLGRLVEVISGQSLDEFFRTRIFEPLGMTDTAFWAPPGPAAERLAAAYMRNPEGADRPAVATDGSSALQRPAVLSGGGGLVGTAGDYQRFALMLRGGGELEGVRLLSPRTVAYMARNQLPGGADLERFGRRLFAETTFDGVGFGLGFSVVIDPAAGQGALRAGRVRMGWGLQHRLLGGPGGGSDDDVLHPVAAVEYPPDPLPAQAAGVPGHRRLSPARAAQFRGPLAGGDYGRTQICKRPDSPGASGRRTSTRSSR